MNHVFQTALYGALFVLFGLAGTVHAAMSEWAHSEGGRMRLVAVSEPRDGAIKALLQIEPKPGWKTYWRNPGDAGLPPELDFGASTNLVLRSISFPVPEVGTDEAGRFIGYHKPVSLVIEFDRPLPDAPSTIKLDALVGICETVCLPFMSSFSLPLTAGAPEPEEFMALQLAEAELPEKASGDFAIRNLRLSDDGKVIMAEITLPRAGAPEVAIAASPGLQLGKVQVETADRSAKLSIPVSGHKAALPRAHVTLLVKSGGRAIEATLALE